MKEESRLVSLDKKGRRGNNLWWLSESKLASDSTCLSTPSAPINVYENISNKYWNWIKIKAKCRRVRDATIRCKLRARFYRKCCNKFSYSTIPTGWGFFRLFIRITFTILSVIFIQLLNHESKSNWIYNNFKRS